MEYLLIVVFLFSASDASAERFFKDSKRGWFWYESKKLASEASELHQNQNASSAEDISALEKLKEFQGKMEEAKAAMIMFPSIQNTKEYIEFQNSMFVKSDQVSRNWQSALLMYPELNIVKDKPISQSGMKISRDIARIESDKILREFAKNYQLLFFYKGSCIYCEKFTDVLKSFSEEYGYKVASITLDGKSLAQFPGKPSFDLVRKLNIEFTPSLFAYSPHTGIALPLAHGYLTLDLLERNVLFAIKQLDGLTQ